MRITGQLIDGPTGGHLWADRYDRDLTDIFAIQDEITKTIVVAAQDQTAAGGEEGDRRRPDRRMSRPTPTISGDSNITTI